MKQKRWKIPYAYLTDQFADYRAYIRAVEAVVRKGDFTLGKALSAFEQAFAGRIGVRHAIGVANGTDALYLALKAIGIGRGDEVITVPNSFIASTAVIVLVGARPVFVDVRDDYTLDPKQLQQAISKKTKAVLPVHLTGTPADMYPILEIANAHQLPVVEDVAQAALGTYDGKYLGSLGMAGCFSFHPLKILNIWGDGGMITTNDDQLAARLRLWRNHGLKDREHAQFFAHNSRLDTIQAAIAHRQLPIVDRIIRRRNHLAALYDRLLADLTPWVSIPDRTLHQAPIRSTFTTYVIQVQHRDALIAYLTKKGVDTRIHYPVPIHLQEAAAGLGHKRGDFPVTETQADTILSLPNHQYLKKADVEYVCECIEKFYKNNKSNLKS